MFAKHCRHCNAKVPEGRGWLENYCCEDHRVAFQDKQHRETVERLRREEPDEQLESEFALHTFEPRRVRVAMMGGATLGPATGFEAAPRPATSYISRPMPPAVNVQPLVAPLLHAKAPVEQSLAALSFVAEPVSAPLQMPNREATPASESLGASVRRAAGQAPVPTTRRNEAIVNLIRGAKERMVVDTDTTTAPSALGSPSPAPDPRPRPQQPNPGKTPVSGARARSIAITIPPANRAELPSVARPSPMAQPVVVNARVATRRTPAAADLSAPSFSSVTGSSQSGEGGQRASIVAVGLSVAVAIGFSYFLLR
jgi:hypothetical protein